MKFVRKARCPHEHRTRLPDRRRQSASQRRPKAARDRWGLAMGFRAGRPDPRPGPGGWSPGRGGGNSGAGGPARGPAAPRRSGASSSRRSTAPGMAAFTPNWSATARSRMPTPPSTGELVAGENGQGTIGLDASTPPQPPQSPFVAHGFQRRRGPGRRGQQRLLGDGGATREAYRLQFAARAGEGFDGPATASLEAADGTVCAQRQVRVWVRGLAFVRAGAQGEGIGSQGALGPQPGPAGDRLVGHGFTVPGEDVEEPGERPAFGSGADAG